MQIILPMIAASMLVTAQALWKSAMVGVKIEPTFQFLMSKTFFHLIFSVQFISGAFLYAITTLFYLYLFSKYSFYSIQSVMLVTSITLALLISVIFFKEPFSVNKLVGLSLLIIGIVTIYYKK